MSGKLQITILLIVFTVLTYAVFRVNSALSVEVDEASNTALEKTRLIDDQLRLVYERQMLLRDMALSQDAFERDELSFEHAARATEFARIRDVLSALSQTPAEKKLFDEQFHIMRNTYPMQLEFVDRILSGDEFDVQMELNERLMPELLLVNDSMLKQRDIVYRNARLIQEDARHQYEKTWSTLLVAYVFTTVIVIGYLLRVLRNEEREKKSLKRDIYIDYLTGLQNRRGFDIALEQALGSGRHSDLLYVDLDDFKIINDTLGHDAGDRVLISVAEVIGRCTRTGDIASRVGGDEFAVILYDCDDREIENIKRRIRSHLSRVQINEQDVSIPLSIGHASTEQGMTAQELIKNADTACYMDKRNKMARSMESEGLEISTTQA